MNTLIQALLDTPIELIISLVVGMQAYRTAYSGLTGNHTAKDFIPTFLIFTFLSWITFRFGLSLLDYKGSSRTDVYNISVLMIVSAPAFAVAMAGAILWRIKGRDGWLAFLRWCGIREDSIATAWDQVIAHGDKEVSQISVHTKNGRVLYMEDRRKYRNAPWEGLYFGSDGSISLIVDYVEKDGKREVRHTDIVDEDFGTRMTYIPASEIERVNIRMK